MGKYGGFVEDEVNLNSGSGWRFVTGCDKIVTQIMSFRQISNFTFRSEFRSEELWFVGHVY